MIFFGIYFNKLLRNRSVIFDPPKVHFRSVIPLGWEIWIAFSNFLNSAPANTQIRTRNVGGFLGKEPVNRFGDFFWLRHAADWNTVPLR